MLIEKPKPHYDVLIVGGGMVGASFALDLTHRTSKLKICVVEAIGLDDKDNQPSFDARSTALSWGTRTVFETMEIWDQLRHVVTPIEEIQVSDQGHFGVTHLNREEQDTEALGYVVENRDLGSVLNSALKDSENIEVIAPASLQSAKPLSAGMELNLESLQQDYTVTADLVVLADGGRSPLCAQLGIDHDKESYDQCALITNIAVQCPHKSKAFERFTAAGPLAVLPLQTFENQNRCSLVWTVNSEDAQELQNCSEEDFAFRLTELFGSRLGAITKVGQRFSYPLVLTEAREQIRPHLVLLGNVAHTLHPVAGQGLNLALRDSACLSATVAEGLARGESPGSMSVLQRYLEQQTPDQHQAIQFTDQMTRLFSSNQTSKVITRKMGLLGLDLIPSLRQEFARRAMGS